MQEMFTHTTAQVIMDLGVSVAWVFVQDHYNRVWSMFVQL